MANQQAGRIQPMIANTVAARSNALEQLPGRTVSFDAWVHWLQISLAFLTTRAALLLCAIVAVLIRNPAPWGGIAMDGPSALWVAVLSRWDGAWYFRLARDGYSYVPGEQSNVAFAPLLPALMHIGGLILGRMDVDALAGVGVVVSNVALLVGVIYLARLVDSVWGPQTARRTIFCLLVFPTSFFLSSLYPESLFFALAVVAFFEADRGRWWSAGLLGALAAITRTYGVLILIPLAWEYWKQRRGRIDPDIAWLLLIPAALLIWQGYLFAITGDPLVMPHAMSAWQREAGPPWQVLSSLFNGTWTLSKVVHLGGDCLFTVVFGLLVALTWRLKRPGLALFSTLLFMPMIFSGTALSSVPRYGLELFPIFVVLAQLTHRRFVLGAYVALAGAVSLVLVALFALGWWIA
jgi:Mannosyltransferase (PIG-V)